MKLKNNANVWKIDDQCTKKNPEKYLAKSLIIEVALPPNDCAVLKVSLRRFAKFFLYCRQFFFAKDALVYGPYRDFIQIDVKSNETRLTYGRVHFSQRKYVYQWQD